MADAKRDNNYVTTLLALSNVDGTTPVPLYADPVTHRLLVSVVLAFTELSDAPSSYTGHAAEAIVVNGTEDGIEFAAIPTNPLTTLGDVIYGGASGVQTRLAGNTTTTRKFLRQTGNGSVSAAPVWDTVQSGDLLELVNFTGTGIKSGFTISINADTTKIDIASGKGYIVNNSSPEAPVFTEITYAGATAITLTNLLTNIITYLAVNSSGTVIQQTTPFTSIQRRSLLLIGAAIHSNLTVVNAVNNLPDVVLDGIAQFNDFLDSLRNFNVTGNVFSANGANLNINKSAGSIFKKGSNFENSNLNPHVLTTGALTAPATLRYRLQNGTEYANTAVIDPANYDLAGVLTAVPTNKWTVQRLTLFSSNLVRIQYGQAYYNSQAEAIQSIPTEVFVTETNIADNGLLRGFIVVKQGATVLNATTSAKFLEPDKFGSVQGVASGSGTTTLQQAYDNGSEPEVLTSTTRGAFSVKRGSAADTDNILEGLNGAGATTFSVTGAGVASATSINKVTLTAPATGSTLTIADGKTLTASNTLTFTGTDSSSVAFGTGGTVLYSGGALGTPSSGTLTNATGLPTAGLVDDAVTLAKMAAGTAGNLITYDASGNPAAVATGTATHVLTSNGVGAAPTFQAAAGGASTVVTSSVGFENLSRYIFNVGGSGANALSTTGITCNTGATATSQATMTWQMTPAQDTVEAGSPTFSTTVVLNTAGSDMQTMFGLGLASNAGSSVTYTSAHIGWKVIRAASGSISLYATQANGSTETASSALTTLAAGDVLELVFKVNGAASVDYYWRKNGGAMSAATNLASNLPSGLWRGARYTVSNVDVASSTVWTVCAASYAR